MEEVLTKKQELVLKVIKDYFLETGQAPSLSELQEMLDISTKRGVVVHLEALERKGYIIRTSNARGIRIIDEQEPVYEYLVGIPILGYANAGIPLVNAEEEDLGTLKMDPDLIKGKEDLFGLIVKGDSMNMMSVNGRNLVDGNYLLVQKTQEVESGDIVVAIIDNSATVKIFKKDKDMVVLYPKSTNEKHKPIYLDSNSESMINGKVVMVLDNPS